MTPLTWNAINIGEHRLYVNTGGKSKYTAIRAFQTNEEARWKCGKWLMQDHGRTLDWFDDLEQCKVAAERRYTAGGGTH